jgi:ketosteroid isomerase-like protein
MEVPNEYRLRMLFAALAAGDLATFLEWCTDDMSLTARGGARTTIVPKREIINWHQSMEALAGSTLEASVCLVLANGHENVVMMRYTFERDGHLRSYEMVNLCTFRSGRLAAWFSYPQCLAEYAEAWGISECQPA